MTLSSRINKPLKAVLMASLTNAGRAFMAANLKQHPWHLAWGRGRAAWGKSHRLSARFEAKDPASTDKADDIVLPHSPVTDVVVTTVDKKPLMADEDYLLDTVHGQLTRLPNGKLSPTDTVIIDYVEATPPESITGTQLVNRVGLRTMDTVVFAVPDKHGELQTPQGNFRISDTPTPALYVSCRFDFSDAADETIQELGVMVGAVMKPDLPAGQRYFMPDQVEQAGTLLLVAHIPPLVRTATTREAFSFVVSF